MAEMRKRTSMSVPEMGRMLGLGKTESYWLIKKNYFKTILVGNTMRVMIDSFEEWYANQFKYQKVDGTPPGEELKKTTYSMEELGQRLGLKEAIVSMLFHKLMPFSQRTYNLRIAFIITSHSKSEAHQYILSDHGLSVGRFQYNHPGLFL